MECYATYLTISFGFCFYFPLWISTFFDTIFLFRGRERGRERERERGKSEKEISLLKKLCDLLDLREKVDKRETKHFIVHTYESIKIFPIICICLTVVCSPTHIPNPYPASTLTSPSQVIWQEFKGIMKMIN